MPRRPGPRTARRSALPRLAPAPSGGPRFRVAPAPRGCPCCLACLHRGVVPAPRPRACTARCPGPSRGRGSGVLRARRPHAPSAVRTAVRAAQGTLPGPLHRAAVRAPAPRPPRVSHRGTGVPCHGGVRCVGRPSPPRLGLPAPPPRAVVRAPAPRACTARCPGPSRGRGSGDLRARRPPAPPAAAYGCPRCPCHAARAPARRGRPVLPPRALAPRGRPRSSAARTVRRSVLPRVARRGRDSCREGAASRGPSVVPTSSWAARAAGPAWSSVLSRRGPAPRGRPRSSASAPVPRVLSRGVTDAVAARALRWPARWDRSRSPSCVRPSDHGGRVPTARRCRVIRVGL